MYIIKINRAIIDAKRAVASVRAITAGLQQHPWLPACRIELCSAQGAVLRGFGLDECEGGPHEFRGVSRGGLLRVLKDLLPEGTVKYGVRIARASTDINGEALCTFPGLKGSFSCSHSRRGT